MKYYRNDIYYSYETAMEGLEKAISEGWAIDQLDLPYMAGFNYSLSLVRDDEPAFKMTRGEIMAKARAAIGRNNKGATDDAE